MGLSESKIIKCEQCDSEYGELAIFSIYHHGDLGGHDICVDCYVGLKSSLLHKSFKNKNKSCKTCENCNYKNKDISSRRLFKVHWFGKFGDRIICEKCIYDKEYRNNN
jgi:hypothetical protein